MEKTPNMQKFALWLLLVAIGSFAQSLPPSTRPVPPTFGCSQPSVGPGFVGNSIEAVAKLVLTSPATKPKGEFETTAQYRERLVGSDQAFIFIVPLAANDPRGWYRTDESEIHYDADLEQVDMSLKYGGQKKYTDNVEQHFLAFDLVSKLTPTARYMGSNGYGVKKAVSQYAESIFGFALMMDDYSDASRNIEELGGHLVFTLPVNEAKTVKPFLRMGIVVRSQSGVFTIHDHLEPRLDFPYDIAKTARYLKVALLRTFAFNSQSGKILGTNPACGAF